MVTARARKNKRTACMVANGCKDHSITLEIQERDYQFHRNPAHLTFCVTREDRGKDMSLQCIL